MKTNYILLLLLTFIFVSCSPFGKVSVVEIKAPDLSWDNSSYDYGSMNLGSMHFATFTLTNRGAASANNCGPIVLSDTVNFSVDIDNCSSSSMAAGEQCDVEIASHPTTVGVKNLTITRLCDDGVAVSTLTNQITATGVTAGLVWSPLSKSFGTTNIGSPTAAEVFTLTNGGAGIASGCSTPVISDTTNFNVTANTCGVSNLNPTGTCIFSVRGNPTTAGLKVATISRTCSTGGTATTLSNQITVTGVGAPTLAWSPLNHAFGGVYVGSNSTAQTFTLSNSGTDAATGCGLPSLSNSLDFSIISDTCSTSNLALSSSCTVQVRANPVTLGVKTTTLSRTCTVGGTVSTTSNQISTTGLSSTPILTWNRMSISFGTSPVDWISPNTSVVLSNTGAPATGCSAPTLTNTTDFTIASDTCGTNNLNTSSSCTVEIRSNVASTGLKTATLERTCSFGGTVSTTANQITVTGVIQADWQQEFNISDLGLMRVGSESTPLTYYYRNPNGVGLTGCSVPTLDNTTDFSIISTTCAAGVQAAQSLCEVKIKANPLSVNSSLRVQLHRACNETGTDISIDLYSASDNYGTVASLSAGVGHTCYLMSDGKAKCLGDGQNGNLGSSGRDGLVDEPGTFTKVSAGLAFSCGALSDQTAKCWGYNGSGQLGDGTNNRTNVPVSVIGLTNVIDVSAYTSHTCALQSTGSIKCWGYNSNGQLGSGNNTTVNTPVSVSGIANAIAISEGTSNHTCAILSGGAVKCWGAGTFGQLGDGVGASSNTPVSVTGITNATQVVTSSYNSCALLSDNTVKCWGVNNFGQIGDGSTNMSVVPVSVTGVTGAVHISANGNGAACAVLSNGTMMCWGRNVSGEFGALSLSNILTPVLIPGISTAVKVAVGTSHTCVLFSDNSVKCVGSSNAINSALYFMPERNLKVVSQPVPGLSSVTAVTNGNSQSCALMSDQTVQCWGFNGNGGLGDGTTETRSTPAVVPGVSNVIQLASASHTCALQSSGSIKCWGANSNGQLGDGTTTARLSPITVPGISNAVHISVSSAGSCAVLSTGEIKCWGDNTYGEIGDGTNTQRLSPVLVLNVNNALKVNTHEYNTCAVLSTGEVKCWGMLYGGYMGGTATLISGISNATNVQVVVHTICVLQNTGYVDCWSGNNSYGLLGDGTMNGSMTPLRVNSLSSITQLVRNGTTMCALKSNGVTQCWGADSVGSLGDGYAATTGRIAAAPIYRLGDPVLNSLGEGSSTNHTCAVNNTGNVVCSGVNDLGQLGSNPYPYRKVNGL